MEAYEEFSCMFCEKNGFTYIKQAKSFNRSKHQPLYDYASDSMKQLVFPLVKYDLQLYNHIKENSP